MVSKHIFESRKIDKSAINGINKWNTDLSAGNFSLSGLFVRTAFTFENKIGSTRSDTWDHATVVASSAPYSWEEIISRLDILKLENGSVFPVGWSDAGHFAGHEKEIRKLVLKIDELQ